MFGNIKEFPKPIGEFVVGSTHVVTPFTTTDGKAKVTLPHFYGHSVKAN